MNLNLRKLIITAQLCLLTNAAATANPEADAGSSNTGLDPIISDSNCLIRYKRYINARFKYGIDYPDFLIPQAEAANGDGIKFKSKNFPSELTVYGQSSFATLDGNPSTISKLMDDAVNSRQQAAERITFKRKYADSFVISGYKGEKIFYFKCMLHDDMLKCFEIIYPRSKKAYFDPVLQHLEKSFKNTK